MLSSEALEREAVASAINETFTSWGYAPIETPMVEELATLERGAGANVGDGVFRLFDADGSLLALRPEMTVPIARVAATRLAEEPGAQRVRYSAQVFREHESFRGQSRQFTQIGVELIGARGPASDAEVVALAADALSAAGLNDFVIAIGTVRLLHDLIGVAGAPEEWGTAVLAAAHDRNLVELDRLAREDYIAPEVGRALSSSLRLRGGRNALEECRQLLLACGLDTTLCNLRETYGVLEALGYAGHVVLDFGIVRSFQYYTGFVLEAYAPGLGLPIGGGGRYDGLLASFEHPAPSAGFAFGLERVMIALAEQGRTPDIRGLDAVIGGYEPIAAFAAARRLRAAGWRVRLAPGAGGLDLVREAERVGAAEALLAEEDTVFRLDRSGERATPVETPPPAPPTATWAEGGAR